MQRFDVLLEIFGRAVFEVVEAERGCIVKEANFEAEKKIILKKISLSTLLLCVMAVFPLEMP